MRSILSVYTFATAVALFLLFISPIFLFFYGPFALVVGLLLLISGLLTAMFVYDYMTYAVEEYKEFAPQGVGLSVLFTLSYAIMYMSLMALGIFGDGAINLVVWASVMISAALMLYVMKNVPLHITSGNPVLDVAAGVKTLPLALLIGLPLAWIFAAFYEALRMFARRATMAGISVMASIFLAPLALLFLSVANVGTNTFVLSVFAPMHAGSMQFTGVEVLAWPGIIGWEELTARFMLPAVGPLANYMFVVLHAPSRWLMTLFLAPAILAVISMGTRWLTEVYKRHGLIGSIAAHSVYNGMLGWLIGLIYFPLLTLVTLVVLAIAYIYVKTRET